MQLFARIIVVYVISDCMNRDSQDFRHFDRDFGLVLAIFMIVMMILVILIILVMLFLVII